MGTGRIVLLLMTCPSQGDLRMAGENSIRKVPVLRAG
jgi:hypothetical protein